MRYYLFPRCARGAAPCHVMERHIPVLYGEHVLALYARGGGRPAGTEAAKAG